MLRIRLIKEKRKKINHCLGFINQRRGFIYGLAQNRSESVVASQPFQLSLLFVAFCGRQTCVHHTTEQRITSTSLMSMTATIYPCSSVKLAGISLSLISASSNFIDFIL